MKFIRDLERKYGRYAVQNLPAIMIALYVAGYMFYLISPRILAYLTLEPYYILHGQVWRLLSWVVIPPSSLGIFTIIMLFFYYSIGKTLERTWGAFRFNLYIFGGILFTILGAFLLYAITGAAGFGVMFSTYYINMSIFLAFALSYPDMQVLLYFVIPIKMKWMGLLYGVFILIEFVQGNWAQRIVILSSLLNFIIYFLLTRDMRRVSPKEIHRRQTYKKKVEEAKPAGHGPMHRCAVCGRTELDAPGLEFRYCSKCDGSYEYCQDHLFSHEHIKRP